MKFDNQLRYATKIIKEYNGSIPLAAWLKEFYRANKQMGSTDRKTVSQMVYGYYRLGHNHFENVEERILAGLDISGQLPELVEYFKSHDRIPNNSKTELSKVFPWSALLSEGIDSNAFARSFFVQPDVYLRIRPGFQQSVIRKLEQAGLTFTLCGDWCVSLPNSSKIDSVIELDKEAVIQDKNSQKTSSLIKDLFPEEKPEVWDCCAASGGKSIMAYDLFEKLQLTVSDIRSTIIHNLQSRFALAGIKDYQSLVTDLTLNDSPLPKNNFDLIIADVPCSGSGTWSRTPEQLYYFKKEKIDDYQQLQKKIVSRVTSRLKSNGFLLYITCSVFREENEEVVQFITEQHPLKLLKQSIFSGYREKADTLFAALFTNSSA